MTPATTGRLRRILVAGNGFEAWLAAGVLAAKLGTAGVRVAVCGVPGSEAWDALYSMLPLHPDDGLVPMRISDLDLVQDLDASFSLGARFEDSAGTCRFFPYGPVGIDYAGVAFHHYWLLAGAHAGDYFRYSPGVRAMDSGVFAPPVPQNAIGNLQHEIARHVVPERLTARLRAAACRAGADKIWAPLAEVRRTSGGHRIECVVTAAGERIESDLYIDCTGPVRRLSKTAAKADWIAAGQSGSPRSYRLAVDRGAAQGPPQPFHEVRACGDGWEIAVPTGSQRIGLGFTDSGRCADDGEAAFIPGHAARPWAGNCVALGHAACALLPAMPIHVQHLMTCIARVIDLMPGPDSLDAESLEFNKLFARDVEAAHDWIALHELARSRGTLDPRALADLPLGEHLRRRLALFSKRGCVPRSDSVLIPRHAWSAALLFHGLVPDHHNLLAERVAAGTLVRSLGELASRIDEVIAGFPPHRVYLDAAGRAVHHAAPGAPSSGGRAC